MTSDSNSSNTIISERAIVATRLRYLLTKYYGLISLHDYDTKTRQFVPGSKYLEWDTNTAIHYALTFPLFLAYYSWQKLSQGEVSGQAIMLYYLTVLVATMQAVAYRVHIYNNNIRLLLNQFYSYSNEVTNFMTSRTALFDEKQQRIIKAFDAFVLIATFFSTALPFSYGVMFCHEKEPIHYIFEEWVEVKMELKWSCAIWLYLVVLLSIGLTTAVFTV